MDTDRPPPKIDYAPAPPWHRRKTATRILIGVAVVLALGLVWRAKPIIVRQVRLLYLQGKCLEYNAPKDEVLITAASARLPGKVPPEWSQFYTLLSPPGLQSGGTLFLHKRVSPKGNRRLIAVDFDNGYTANLRSASYSCAVRVIKPGFGVTAPSENVQPSPFGTMHGFPDGKIIAGTPDPNDLSHFTIESILTLDGVTRRRITDGWLRDDDTVLLESREEEVVPTHRPTSQNRTEN
jgi:hypothetical protein